MILFKNKKHQEFFNKNGYLQLALLQENQVSFLLDIYNRIKKNHSEKNNVLYSTTDSSDSSLTLKVNESIINIVEENLKEVFKSFEIYLSTFLIKVKGEKYNQTPFHLDPSFVDENKFQGATIWIPLNDVDQNNGCLKIIKGSHKLTKTIRPTPNFPYFFQKYTNSLDAYSTPLPLKTGEAVIISNRLIHGAFENKSDMDRIAVAIGVYSKGANLYLYFQENKFSEIEQYSMDLNSFSKLEKNKRPQDSAVLNTFSPKYDKISFFEFNLFYLRSYPLDFFSKIFKKGFFDFFN
jgi:hypothetical protein